VASSTETAIPANDAEIGAVIDERYRLIERIGLGGMGAVYKAEHVGMGRVVAVKLLRPEMGGRQEAIDRFTREAQASARVAHKNVCAVSDFGVRADGALYLVMELLRGETLRERLDRVGRLPWQSAVAIARHVARGLAHAHAQGVVHRDVKPENVFLVVDDDDPDFAKILDFGIARSLENDDARVTQAGFVVGTPAYLSPEQALGGTVDHRCDIYSLCIVLYEMIVGRTPFGDRPPVAMLTAHAVVDVPPFAEVAPDVECPPAVEELVRKGLAKEKDGRHASADELTLALDAVRGVTPRLTTGIPAQRVSTGHPVAYAYTPLPGPAPTGSNPMITPAPPVPSGPEGILQWFFGTFPWLRDKAFVLKWGKIALIGALALGVLVAIMTSGNPDKKGGAGGTTELRVPVLVPDPAAREEKFKAAAYELEKGATCEDRKAAVAKLRDLRDPRAIPLLKRARYRMRGGVLGVGDSNTNKCLKADAEAAMAALGAPAP
jgi:tRNA A-37 threonylcarbamoyl transferase component Bud32